MNFVVDVAPRFNYARAGHEVALTPHGALFRAPDLALGLSTRCPLQIVDGRDVPHHMINTPTEGYSPKLICEDPSIRPATVFVCNLGLLGNPSIVTVFWPSLRHGRAASTFQESRERDCLAVRDGQQPTKSDPGAGLKNDWVTALLVTLQLVMLVLLVTGQIQ